MIAQKGASTLCLEVLGYTKYDSIQLARKWSGVQFHLEHFQGISCVVPATLDFRLLKA